MNKITGCILGLFVIMLSLAGGNSLLPSGKAYPLSHQITVVIPENATRQEAFAGRLLCKYLTSVTCRQVPMAIGRTSGPGIYLANASATAGLGDIGYEIRKDGDNWFIIGGSRSGPVNGVLALLEEDIGCRWYAPDSPPVIPKQDEVRVVPRRFVPPFLVRDPFFYSALNNPEWAGYNRTNPYFLGEIPIEFGSCFKYSHKYFTHTFNLLFPLSLQKKHLEYFPLIDGKRIVSENVQRCLTASGMVDVAVGKLMEEIQKTPDVTVYSVAQNDIVNGWCECVPCARLIAAEGYSGYILDFVNRVALKIARHFPKIQIATLAYQQTSHPPATIRPVKNVIIVLCTDTHAQQFGTWNYGQFFPVSTSKKFMASLHGWTEAGARIQVWDYVVDFLNYPLPQPNIAVMDTNINTYLENGAMGVMMQGAYQSPGASLEYLKNWVLAKKLWDPSRSLIELSYDFIDGYYRSAAPYMRRYFELQFEFAAELSPENPPPGMCLPDLFIKRSKKLLMQAVAVVDDPMIKRQIEIEEFCVRYLQMKNGGTDPAEAKEYSTNLKWLVSNQKRLGIKLLCESGDDKALYAEGYRRARFLNLSRYSEHARYLTPSLMTQNAIEITDADALAGYAIKQLGRNDEWSVQYPYRNFIDGMKPGEDYILRLRWRFEQETKNISLKKTPVPVFMVGFFSELTRDFSSRRFITGTSDNLKYRWLTVARLRRDDSAATGMIYLAPVNSTPIYSIMYDMMELIPIAEYRDSLSDDLPVFILK